MEGYVLTEGRKNALQNASFAKGQYFNPVQDVNGTWYIFEQEKKAAEPLFSWAKDLTLSEYVAPERTLPE